MFQFKRFTIEQDRTAMKVCTDACLFGAWIAGKIENGELKPGNILDIGAGTGLLSLMIAQKTEAKIDAAEIDDAAAMQAAENIRRSPFSGQVKLLHTDIRSFPPEKNYDLIISNPPFFENQLSSPDKQRNKAMHSSSLSFGELAASVKNHLSPEGKFAALIPYDRAADLKKEMENIGLFTIEQLDVSHSPSHPFFRTCLLFSFTQSDKKEATLSVKNNATEYTSAFHALLKDYYLNF